jgi:CheY-like chemotaxis protein
MVVDDEAISRRALVYALEKAKLKSVSVEDPLQAFQMLSQDQYDLIFLDVDMPNMSGFELCSRLRTLPAYKQTPVVFVTNLNDFESRANSTMSGGNDFIAKPFLFIELAVKALVYVLRGQLEPARV